MHYYKTLRTDKSSRLSPTDKPTQADKTGMEIEIKQNSCIG